MLCLLELTCRCRFGTRNSQLTKREPPSVTGYYSLRAEAKTRRAQMRINPSFITIRPYVLFLSLYSSIRCSKANTQYRGAHRRDGQRLARTPHCKSARDLIVVLCKRVWVSFQCKPPLTCCPCFLTRPLSSLPRFIPLLFPYPLFPSPFLSSPSHFPLPSLPLSPSSLECDTSLTASHPWWSHTIRAPCPFLHLPAAPTRRACTHSAPP